VALTWSVTDEPPATNASRMHASRFNLAEICFSVAQRKVLKPNSPATSTSSNQGLRETRPGSSVAGMSCRELIAGGPDCESAAHAHAIVCARHERRS
jgi:hypothetical protein